MGGTQTLFTRRLPFREIVTTPDPAPPPAGRVRRFLLGPKLVDRGGLAFLLGILVLVATSFGVAFYAWSTSHTFPPPAPVRFTNATMMSWNATFSVASIKGGPFPSTNFTVQFTFNNFASNVVPLAASGANATVVIGNGGSQTAYHIRWIDADRDHTVSVGDVFWITGDGKGLSPLSYCNFSLIWDRGVWTSQLYWTTSATIV